MTDLLIGLGEVGSALHEVLSERRKILVVDPSKGLNPEAGKDSEIEWMHVAIPYSNDFTRIISDYVQKWKPKRIILHSTIPVGTTRKIEREADYIPTYFSPVRGRHPNLARYLRDFPKHYASSIAGEMDAEIESYFAIAGIQTRKATNFETLEWAKLIETFTYGYNLILWQELERQVAKLPGDRHANLSYAKSWLHEKKRIYDGDLGYVPIYDLVPGPIGGHCILPNLELLEPMMDPDLYNWLVKSNGMRK